MCLAAIYWALLYFYQVPRRLLAAVLIWATTHRRRRSQSFFFPSPQLLTLKKGSKQVTDGGRLLTIDIESPDC